jgi:SAM-dependent methyltransferase
MTQAYGPAFARVYNQRWAGFAINAAPLIRKYYESTPAGEIRRSLLDLCCGTGQMARHFLENGYTVTGIDLSQDMLNWARENNLPFLTTGAAAFIQGDAVSFELEHPVGLVVSLFDALNHLPGLPALQNCFGYVRASLHPGGMFIFDLNTCQGLKRQWTGISIDDLPELFMCNRSIWIEDNLRAYVRITGFVRQENGTFERFEQTVFNSTFELEVVRQALVESGFRSVHISRLADLATPLEAPEQENRIFFVATL